MPSSVAPEVGTIEAPAGLGLAIDLDAVPAIEPPLPAVAAAAAAPAGYASVSEPARPVRRGALPARARGRTAPRVYALSREDEYAYIQEDMKRLLAIAGVLLVLMIALLFVLER